MQEIDMTLMEIPGRVITTKERIELVLEAISDSERALDAASTMDEMIAIHDRSEAIQYLSRKAKLARSVQNTAALLTIKTERRLGEYVASMQKNRGAQGNPGGQGFCATDNAVPTYDDIGITYREASRWQTIANLPEHRLEEFVHEIQEADYELTVGGVYSFAKNWKSKHATPREHIFGKVRKTVYEGKLSSDNFIQVVKLLKACFDSSKEIDIRIDRLEDPD